jgi:hypothetical protein
MRIAPINLIDFDEPVPVSATSTPMIPHALFTGVAALAMLASREERRRPRARIRVSIPEGMRVRIRCA